MLLLLLLLLLLQGNYDSFVKTREELDENQMKKYRWEQDQIAHMKVTTSHSKQEIQVNLDMTDSMGPGEMVRHMQNPLIHMTNTWYASDWDQAYRL